MRRNEGKTHPIYAFLLLGCLIGLLLAIPFFPVKSNREVTLPRLNNIEGQYALFFFGFPGCADACPIALTALNQVYQRFQKERPEDSLSVVFIDLTPPVNPDDLEGSQEIMEAAANVYARSFNEQFQAIYLGPDEMTKAKYIFGLKFSPPDEFGTIQHKGWIYLLNKKDGVWWVRTVYTSGPPPVDQLLGDLEDLRMGKMN